MHDIISKVLYSLPETIAALARAVAPGRSADMDFSSLARLAADYPATGQRPRYGDMLWECRLHDGTPVLIVIEFQSRVDHVMPLRLFQYTGSAWLEWARVRGVAAGAGIPLVLPVLIYGGRRRWTPPLKLAGLMPVAGQRWLATQPRFEYLLLEERRGGTGDLPENNLVTELVAVARARGRKAIVGAVSRLRDRMDEEEGGTLDQAVAAWLKSVIADLDARLGAELETAGTTREVVEVIKAKTKWAVRWYEDGVDDGREQGIKQGIKQGIEQGIVRAIEQQWRLLHRLVERKFGVEAARKLAEASGRQSHLDFEAVFAAALDCDTADEFMAWMGEHATPSPATPHATADT